MGSIEKLHTETHNHVDNEQFGDDDTDAESIIENDSSQGHIESNIGWSDSIANILKTNNRKDGKALVLSKAKKRNILNEPKLIPVGFEIATESGEIKAEKIAKETKKEAQISRQLKKYVLDVRVKPNIVDRDRERIFAKIATKGVVQLFNAVRMQQKDISAKVIEAGPLEARRENALKSIDKKNFLNLLMGRKSESVKNVNDNVTVTNSISDSSWSVLKDEYKMSAKLKDWDKEIDQEVEME